MFAFHDSEEIGRKMLAKIAKKTGLRPEDLWREQAHNRGGTASVNDGVISEADVRQGGHAVQVWLPAGEVYCLPVPGTAEGTVVHTRDFFEVQEIRDLTLTFAGGRLVSITGSGPGFEALRKRYDAAGDGKV